MKPYNILKSLKICRKLCLKFALLILNPASLLLIGALIFFSTGLAFPPAAILMGGIIIVGALSLGASYVIKYEIKRIEGQQLSKSVFRRKRYNYEWV